MCGFAGVVTWDEKYRVTPETLGSMSAAVAHRGPDGEGFHINHHDSISIDKPQVALAFRRLAILDPDPRSNQPFTDGRRWLLFNGEIYNFRELRRELTALHPDGPWHTAGDTEVLLRAYTHWREDCIHHLDGMFAFVIWDDIQKKLFMARDRMGQKPLYVARTADGHAIAFASEVQAFHALPWFRPEINRSALIQYLRYGYINGSDGMTIYQNAAHLAPAQEQFAAPSSPWQRNYFDPNAVKMPEDDAHAVGTTRQLLTSAVEKQLVSDVPIGVFLSGGVDSSVVAACARMSGEVETFSIGFEDPRYDETQHAAAVARHLGTKHHRFNITPRVAEDLPKLAAVFGEPFADSSALPTHYLARETRQWVKVALSGDGGDELFGGYDRYRALQLASRLDRLVPLSLRRHLEPETRGHPKSIATRARRFLSVLSTAPPQRYPRLMRLFDDALIHALLPDVSIDVSNSLAETFASQLEHRDPAPAAMAADRITYLPDDLLTKVDRAAMLHALEVRSPFMDHQLVGFAAGLTTNQLLQGGPKRMLREAFKDDLPEWVFKRTKMGFAVPIGEWFKAGLRSLLRDSLFAADSFARQHFDMNVIERLIAEHEQNRLDHSQRLYALLMLELWWNTVKS